MAKREFSSTLKNLKFMQRVAKKEEKKPPEAEEAELKPDGVFGSPAALRRKCIVIMEGNPHPGAINGRMSFQDFNPSLDKMNQEAANSHKLQAFSSSNENQKATTSDRDGSDPSGYTNRESPGNHPETDLKRKQPVVETEASHPRDSEINLSGDASRRQSQNNRRGSYKQQKRGTIDWNVLRPPKAQARKDSS